jgi:hypothetical protein
LNVETASVQIDTLIARRASERGKANELSEVWRSSERAYQERHRRRIRAEWYAYFCRLEDTVSGEGPVSTPSEPRPCSRSLRGGGGNR